MEDSELSGGDGESVEKDGGEHDPADGEEPEEGAMGRGGEGGLWRHAVAEDCDEESRSETEQSGVVGFRAEDEGAEEEGDG